MKKVIAMLLCLVMALSLLACGKTPEAEEAVPADTKPIEYEQPAQKVEKKAEAPKREAAEGECPNGYEYGKDCERQPLCSRCPDPIWSKCDACRRRMNRK